MSATIDKIQFNSHITLDFAHFEQLYQDKNQDIFVEKYKPVASNYTRSLVCFEPDGDYDSKGMTQEALANESGVSLNTIRAYERKSKDLNKASFDIVMRLAKALKCEVSELID